MVTWRHDDNNQLITDSHNDLEKIMRKGGRARKNAGGYLAGPSHEQGGIPASFQNGGEAIELEGGEYIINAQTVNAVGTEFLDQLNSTQTTYHQGGFNAGELPNPSNYRAGGKVRRKKQRGGRAVPKSRVTRKRGGRTKSMQYGGNVQTNLYTEGNEYRCTTSNYPGCDDGPNQTYVGSMHYHPEKGYMAGATHSQQSHPILQSVMSKGSNNRKKRNVPVGRSSRRVENIKNYQMGGQTHNSSNNCSNGTIWNGMTCIPT